MASTAQHVNVERARRAYRAFDEGDMATLNELMTDDTVWHIGGQTPLSGDYRGRQAVFGFFQRVMELSGGTFKLEVHDVLANDDHVVALVTERAERHGKTLTSRAAHITHVDGEGRTKEFWAFFDDMRAVDDFWS